MIECLFLSKTLAERVTPAPCHTYAHFYMNRIDMKLSNFSRWFAECWVINICGDHRNVTLSAVNFYRK